MDNQVGDRTEEPSSTSMGCPGRSGMLRHSPSEGFPLHHKFNIQMLIHYGLAPWLQRWSQGANASDIYKLRSYATNWIQ
jgi:hypothetical protein